MNRNFFREKYKLINFILILLMNYEFKVIINRKTIIEMNLMKRIFKVINIQQEINPILIKPLLKILQKRIFNINQNHPPFI